MKNIKVDSHGGLYMGCDATHPEAVVVVEFSTGYGRATGTLCELFVYEKGVVNVSYLLEKEDKDGITWLNEFAVNSKYFQKFV